MLAAADLHPNFLNFQKLGSKMNVLHGSPTTYPIPDRICGLFQMNSMSGTNTTYSRDECCACVVCVRVCVCVHLCLCVCECEKVCARQSKRKGEIYSHIRMHDACCSQQMATWKIACRINWGIVTFTVEKRLQHTATHCNALQHTATQDRMQNKLENSHIYSGNLDGNRWQLMQSLMHSLKHSLMHSLSTSLPFMAARRDCNTLQRTATHCNTPQHIATPHMPYSWWPLENSSQSKEVCQTASGTHCNTLQHAAPHRNTLQRTATHYHTHALELMASWK